jgi:hypothetical protein
MEGGVWAVPAGVNVGKAGMYLLFLGPWRGDVGATGALADGMGDGASGP